MAASSGSTRRGAQGLRRLGAGRSRRGRQFQAPSQVVIAGHKRRSARGGGGEAAGAKRAVMLPVSDPFHSSLCSPRLTASRVLGACSSRRLRPPSEHRDVAFVTESATATRSHESAQPGVGSSVRTVPPPESPTAGECARQGPLGMTTGSCNLRGSDHRSPVAPQTLGALK